MKWAFLAAGILNWIMFIVSLVIRLTTREITDWHYPSQIIGLLCIGVFFILYKLDKFSKRAE